MKRRTAERLIDGDTLRPKYDYGQGKQIYTFTHLDGDYVYFTYDAKPPQTGKGFDHYDELKLTPETRARLRAAQAAPILRSACCGAVILPDCSCGHCLQQCIPAPEQPYVPGQAVEVHVGGAWVGAEYLGCEYESHAVNIRPSFAVTRFTAHDIRPCAAVPGCVVLDRQSGAWLGLYGIVTARGDEVMMYTPEGLGVLVPLSARHVVMLLPRQPEWHSCCGGRGVHTTACNRDGQNPPLDLDQPTQPAEQPAPAEPSMAEQYCPTELMTWLGRNYSCNEDRRRDLLAALDIIGHKPAQEPPHV